MVCAAWRDDTQANGPGNQSLPGNSGKPHPVTEGGNPRWYSLSSDESSGNTWPAGAGPAAHQPHRRERPAQVASSINPSGERAPALLPPLITVETKTVTVTSTIRRDFGGGEQPPPLANASHAAWDGRLLAERASPPSEWRPCNIARQAYGDEKTMRPTATMAHLRTHLPPGCRALQARRQEWTGPCDVGYCADHSCSGAVRSKVQGYPTSHPRLRNCQRGAGYQSSCANMGLSARAVAWFIGSGASFRRARLGHD